MAQDDESDAGPPIASGRPNWPFRGTPVERPGCICRLGSPRPRADRSEADDLWKHPWIDPMKTLVGGRTVRILTIIVIAIGVVGILISLPVLGLAALGYLGALADVGPAQNRIMGLQLLSLGLPLLIGGVVSCVLGLRALAWSRRRAAAGHPSGIGRAGLGVDHE